MAAVVHFVFGDNNHDMMIIFVIMVWIVPWEGSGNNGSQQWQWPQWWQRQWQVSAVVDTVDGELLSWECDHIVQTALNFHPGGLLLYCKKRVISTTGL